MKAYPIQCPKCGRPVHIEQRGIREWFSDEKPSERGGYQLKDVMIACLKCDWFEERTYSG